MQKQIKDIIQTNNINNINNVNNIKKIKKIALLIGINYTGTKIKLNGCHNDVFIIKDILISQYDYNENNIICLIDEPNYIQPTASNIMEQLNFLYLQTKTNKVCEIYIHYSGHGNIFNKNKLDGKKYIVPIDYKKSGVISNQNFYTFLYNLSNLSNSSKIKKLKKITIVLDCCNSANFINLPFSYVSNDFNIVEKQINNNDLNMQNIDTFILSSYMKSNLTYENNNNNNQYYGLLTINLKKSLEKLNYTCSIEQLITYIKNEFENNSENNSKIPIICVCSNMNSFKSVVYEKKINTI